MDYDDARRYLNGRLRRGVKLVDERFLALLERLGGPCEEITEAEIERRQAVVKEIMAETARLGLYK